MQFSTDEKGNWGLDAWGVGCCGIDVSTEINGKTLPYSEPMPTFRSKNLEEVYGL